MGHHPDLEISWDTVKVTISTHSEGGLTAADFELAGRSMPYRRRAENRRAALDPAE